MKNRTKYIISFLLFSFIFASCDSIIEREPKDTMRPETFFKTAKECEVWTNKYYSIFPTASANYGETDDIIVKDRLTEEVRGARIIPTDVGTGGYSWGRLRDVNLFLEWKGNLLDEDARNEYEAVSRFFRAYFYLGKVARFGDVPWVDKVFKDTDPDLYKGRDSREYIMDRVLEDINFAIDFLPEQKDVYKISKWTALALKSRIFLFEGTFRKYHGIAGYEDMLKESVKASEEFITSSGYSLYTTGPTPYLDLFASLNAIDSEIILARSYNTDIGLKHNANGYSISPSQGKPGMMQDIANTYLMSDGTPYTDQVDYETMDFVTQCKNRDLRFSQTVRTPGYKRIGGTAVLPPDLSRSYTGLHLIKYVNSDKYDAHEASTNDMPLFRTAEVYLNHAEAKAELGTLMQEDLDQSLNKLRERAGVARLNMDAANATPDPYLLSPKTGYKNISTENTGVILEIRRERTIELIMEGFRYNDIMRWKEGRRFDRQFEGLYFPGEGVYDLDQNGVDDVCIYTTEKAPNLGGHLTYLKLGEEIILSNGTSGNIVMHGDIARKWNEDKDYLYPIPTEDRVLTNGAITQNPGWDDGLSF